MKKINVGRLAFHIPLLAFLLLLLLFRWGIPHVLLAVEADSLYMDTPDYWHQMSQEHAWPFWYVVREFVCQFFVDPWMGAALLALGLSVPFYIVNAVFRRYRRVIGVSAVVQLAIMGGAVAYVLCADTQSKENRCRLEQSAMGHNWEDVLQVATPEAVKADRDKLPYAMLALAVRGELADRMLEYPLGSSNDFDMGKPLDRRFYTFRMVLYDCMGCPNEALHNAFQLASLTRCGMSLGILRQLVRYSREKGDMALAAKYGRILATSTLHFSRQASAYVLPPATDTMSVKMNAFQPLLTERLGYNMGELLDAEKASPRMYHYFLCMLLADCQLVSFATVLQRVRPLLPGPLPRLYQEALLTGSDRGVVLSGLKDDVDSQVMEEYVVWKTGGTAASAFPLRYWQYFSLGIAR